MSRKKSVALVIIITFAHFGLMVALVISQLSCGMQPNCTSVVGDAAGQVLALPLSVVGLGLELLGIDVDEGVRRYLWGGFPVLNLLNSLLAALIIWFGVVKPLHRRKLQRQRRSA